ncbi:MAG TPA: hypothetical protein VGR78_14990 [Verrucomicrobiae bacterium]|jgi:tetratricopeptide (TPR) repeat protein|nr:hypothetical protein [Verrucomicrobiae bacterium]
MERGGQYFTGLVGLIGAAALVVWFAWRTIKNSDDPGRLIMKWVLTAAVAGMFLFCLFFFGRDGALVLPGLGAGFGVVLGIIWAPQLGAMLAKPITSFYDGGSAEVEARPFYAIARAKQKRGQYEEALAAIRGQLDKFPEDYEGWMLMAEIYARDLKDNAGAQNCIEEILRHGTHTPKNVAFALNCSSDWHLNLASDREAARFALERIVAMFPETEFAHSAAQRIPHLASDQMLAEQKERPRLALKHYDEHIGLRGEVADPRPKEDEPPAKAARLVSHLNDFPEDVEAREELAKIYADHYQRMDLATDQIEQLVASPGAGPKEIVRWLNMLADYHIRVDQDRPAAEAVLHRIMDLFPNTALAAKAESRLAYLEGEMRKNKTSQALTLGSYEENLGLKGQLPKTPG